MGQHGALGGQRQAGAAVGSIRDLLPPSPLSYQKGGLSPSPQGDAVAAANLPILLEVNVSGEASKYGFRPEELPAAVEAIAALPACACKG